MIIDGRLISNEIKKKLKKEINALNESLTLCVIQIGNDEASNIYIRQKMKIATEIGINFKHIRFDENENEEIIENEIKKLNDDSNITGMILQLPIPSRYSKDKLINLINPLKDIDGLTKVNQIHLYSNESGIYPCTPSGIIELLKYYDIGVSGKHVVIIGRSNLVSKPLFNILLNMDATVTMCHSKTKNLSDITRLADILISATGQAHLIKEDMVKEGAIVIDVGISRIDNKLYGDVDFEKVSKKASYITPNPGGVGPMTVIMLMNNLLIAYKKQKN